MFIQKNILLFSFLFSVALSQLTQLSVPQNCLNSLPVVKPKNDSTLKLLQIIHRLGDRNPDFFAPNDPFNSDTYFPGGFDQLTLQGKYRLYEVGEFIRREYSGYLGSAMSPREVYTQSSHTNRTMESAQCLNAGAYPPGKQSNISYSILFI